MDSVSHREAQSRYLRERTLGSLLGELDSEYPPQVVSILELPPGVDTGKRETLSLEESFDRRGIVFGQIRPHPLSVRAGAHIEIHDQQGSPGPQDAHGFTNSRAAAFAEKVRRTGMNEID